MAWYCRRRDTGRREVHQSFPYQAPDGTHRAGADLPMPRLTHHPHHPPRPASTCASRACRVAISRSRPTNGLKHPAPAFPPRRTPATVPKDGIGRHGAWAALRTWTGATASRRTALWTKRAVLSLHRIWPRGGLLLEPHGHGAPHPPRPWRAPRRPAAAHHHQPACRPMRQVQGVLDTVPSPPAAPATAAGVRAPPAPPGGHRPHGRPAPQTG